MIISTQWFNPIPLRWRFSYYQRDLDEKSHIKTKMLTWKTLKTNCENSRVPSRAWVSELASGSRWCKRDFKHEAKTIYTSFTFHKIVPPSENPPLSEHFQHFLGVFRMLSHWNIPTNGRFSVFNCVILVLPPRYILYSLFSFGKRYFHFHWRRQR